MTGPTVSRREMLSAVATAPAVGPMSVLGTDSQESSATARDQNTPVTDQRCQSVFADNQNTGRTGYDAPSQFETGWRRPLDAQITGHPVHCDGVIYIPTGNQLSAVRASDGAIQWQRSLPGRCSFGVAVSQQHLYAATLDAESDSYGIHAFDRLTGDQVWSQSLPNSIQCVPTVTETSVYIGDEGGVVYALDRTDGRVRWTHTGESIWGGPLSVTADTVFAQSRNGSVRALARTDGSIRWTADLNVEGFWSPVLGRDLVCIGGFRNDGSLVAAVDIATGAVVWEQTVEGGILLPGALINDTIIVQTGRSVRALGVDDGTTRWSVASNGTGGVVATSSAIYTLTKQRLRAIDPDDQTTLATFSASSALQWTPVILPDRIVVGTDDGVLRSLGPVGGWPRENLVPISAAGVALAALVGAAYRFFSNGT